MRIELNPQKTQVIHFSRKLALHNIRLRRNCGVCERKIRSITHLVSNFSPNWAVSRVQKDTMISVSVQKEQDESEK